MKPAHSRPNTCRECENSGLLKLEPQPVLEQQPHVGQWHGEVGGGSSRRVQVYTSIAPGPAATIPNGV